MAYEEVDSSEKINVLITGTLSYLSRRDDGYDDGDGSPQGYVKWVFVGVIVVVVVSLMVMFYFYAKRRRERLQSFWSGGNSGYRHNDEDSSTQIGMFSQPRTHHRNRRRHSTREVNEDVDPVPTYHADPGDDDLGFYDAEGNYNTHEPPPYDPPKAAVRREYESS